MEQKFQESDESKCMNEQLNNELLAVKEEYEKKIKLLKKQHEETIEKVLSEKKTIEKSNVSVLVIF